MKIKSKKVEMDISYCWQCPFCRHDTGDGESPWEFDICQKTDEHLSTLWDIPDFCPLPNSE